MRVERLDHPDQIDRLARIAREEGFGFLDRLLREWEDGTNRFGGPGESLFGAFVGGELVGTGGITNQGPGLGRVRRVYVRPDSRRRGVASGLVGRVLTFAREHYAMVVLNTETNEGARFYERLGFVPESSKTLEHATHRLVLGSVASVAKSPTIEEASQS